MTIAGALAASDLRRLESICGPALAHFPAPLDLHVDGLTTTDDASRLFLHRLVQRGATLRGTGADHWADAINHPADQAVCRMSGAAPRVPCGRATDMDE